MCKRKQMADLVQETTILYFSLSKDKHMRKECRNTGRVWLAAARTARAPAAGGWLAVPRLRPAGRVPGRAGAGLSAPRTAPPLSLSSRAAEAVTQNTLWVVVRLPTSRFPAGGEASNAKEHPGLFFHAC